MFFRASASQGLCFRTHCACRLPRDGAGHGGITALKQPPSRNRQMQMGKEHRHGEGTLVEPKQKCRNLCSVDKHGPSGWTGRRGSSFRFLFSPDSFPRLPRPTSCLLATSHFLSVPMVCFCFAYFIDLFIFGFCVEVKSCFYPSWCDLLHLAYWLAFRSIRVDTKGFPFLSIFASACYLVIY